MFRNDKMFHICDLRLKAAQVQQEERLLEEEKKNALNSLRERLSQETQQALKEQEHTMGETIARLEVGQARRQAIISKQDTTIKELEVSQK